MWVTKAAASHYRAMPVDPAEVDVLRAAFTTAVQAALTNPDFSFARLSDLLGGPFFPLDVITEHFPFDVFESMYPDALAAIHSQLVDAGRTSNGRLGWPFDDRDLNVIFWTRSHAAALISSLTDSQRRSLNQLLLRSTLDRNSVDQIAAELRQVLGLHPAWANAVTRFHRKLLDDGAAPAFARRQADRYQTRLIKSRAWMVARTEVMAAQNMGQKIGWNQAITLDTLPANSLMKWVAAVGHPTPPCVVCLNLHDTTVPIVGGQFQTSVRLASGAWRIHRAEVPPIHPRCRCRLVLVRAPRRERPSLLPPGNFPLLPYGPDIPQPPRRGESLKRPGRPFTPLNPRRTPRSTFRKTLGPA